MSTSTLPSRPSLRFFAIDRLSGSPIIPPRYDLELLPLASQARQITCVVADLIESVNVAVRTCRGMRYENRE